MSTRSFNRHNEGRKSRFRTGSPYFHELVITVSTSWVRSLTILKIYRNLSISRIANCIPSRPPTTRTLYNPNTSVVQLDCWLVHVPHHGDMFPTRTPYGVYLKSMDTFNHNNNGVIGMVEKQSESAAAAPKTVLKSWTRMKASFLYKALAFI